MSTHLSDNHPVPELRAVLEEVTDVASAYYGHSGGLWVAMLFFAKPSKPTPESLWYERTVCSQHLRNLRRAAEKLADGEMMKKIDTALLAVERFDPATVPSDEEDDPSFDDEEAEFEEMAEMG